VTARTRAVRVLAGYATLLVVALALAAAAAAPHSSGSGLAGAAPVARTTLEAALGLLVCCGLVLLVALIAQRRRRNPDEELPLSRLEPPSLWARILALLVAVLVLAGAITVVIVLLRSNPAATPPPLARRGGVPPPSLPPTPAPTPGSSSAGELVAAAAVVGAVLLLVALAHARQAWRRRRAPAAGPPPDAGAEPGPEPGRMLAGALDDAVDALDFDGPPRQVIIACYRAMTRRLARAGAEPTAADAPEELLERAARSGLVVPQPARELAALFQEARFSTHPVGPAQQRRAAAALDTLRRALAVRR
jgi:hypothetical protein